jgi:hypothetical protein
MLSGVVRGLRVAGLIEVTDQEIARRAAILQQAIHRMER